MSSVLGPVHEKMYSKIKFQDRLTAMLLDDQPGLLAQLNEAMPPVIQGEIARLIDSPNIHGWLAARIDVVEARLAFALAHARTPFEKLYDYGARVGSGKQFSDYNSLFLDIYTIILDGMPCDGAINAVLDDSGELIIHTNHDLHSAFEANPLEIDPSQSLDKTCSGHDDDGEGHDHHHQMSVSACSDRIDVGEESEGYEKASHYYKARYHLLRGYLSACGAQVRMINAHDYRIRLSEPIA